MEGNGGRGCRLDGPRNLTKDLIQIGRCLKPTSPEENLETLSQLDRFFPRL